MTDLERYRSAMAKVTPSEAWKADTLAKLAEAEREKAGQARPARAVRWRKAALPLAAAAAFALLAVPAALRNGAAAGTEAASPQSAPALFRAQPEAGAAPQENAPALGGSHGGDAAENRKSDGAGFDLGEHNGLPVLVWGDELSGGSGSQVVYLAEHESELQTQNPTRDLPAESLPAELPVWRAQSGPQGGRALQALLQQAAGFLGLALEAEDPGAAPEGYPFPTLWPYSLRGSLTGAAPQEGALWELYASGIQLTLWDETAADADDPAQYSDPAAARRGDDAALARFGALAGLETPAYQPPAVTYTYAGEAVYEWFAHFYYEAGGEADTINEKLFNYSFKRVYGSLNAAGALQMARLTLPPGTETVGSYPVRSLADAKAALQAVLDAELAGGGRDYPLGEGDVVSWELEYDQSSMNPYIQPVYTFTLKTPLTPAEAGYQAFAGAEQLGCYVRYSVSALPPEYAVGWAEHFN